VNRRLLLANFAAVLAFALAAGCSVPGGGGPSAAQVMSDAFRGLLGAGSFHVSGSLTFGDTYGLDLTAAGGNVDGTIGHGRVPVAVRSVGIHEFEHGAQYFHLNNQPLVSDSYWVLNDGSELSKLVRMLADWKSLVQDLESSAGSVSQVPGPVVSGQRTIGIVGEGLSMLIPEKGGRVPLSLTTMPGHELHSHLSNLSLVFDKYGGPVTMDAPTAVIDLDDHNTLPVHDVPDVTTFRIENCDRGGCTLSSDFVNSGGRQGSATATFGVGTTAGQALTSCEVAIPVLDNKGRTRLGCRLNFDDSQQVSTTVRANDPDGID
jgi:hypothetical protein